MSVAEGAVPSGGVGVVEEGKVRVRRGRLALESPKATTRLVQPLVAINNVRVFHLYREGNKELLASGTLTAAREDGATRLAVGAWHARLVRGTLLTRGLS